MTRIEAERLKVVNRFLNLKINQKNEMQDIVKQAAELCGTPTALITLIDRDTQVIRFNQNFDLETTARHDSFCNSVLNQYTVLMIPDTLADKRFANNPLVIGNPNIRFYVGAPLTTHDGYNLGSLCVIDTKPNYLTEIQQNMLRILAKQVVQLFEFEASLDILKKQFLLAKSAEIKMRAFFDSSASSYILLDEQYRVIAFNKAVKDFIRIVYDVNITKGMKITKFIRKSHMQDFITNYNKAMSGETLHHQRLLRFGNIFIFCDITYNPARNADGEIIGVSYNSIDITKRNKGKEALIVRQATLNRIANIQSHELRKPVANIKGLVGLLEMDGLLQDNSELEQMKLAVAKLDEAIILTVNYASTN